LKRAKKLRVDPFAIQRQIAKEEALFCAFLIAAVISIGLMFLAVRETSNFGVRVMYFGLYVLPVLGLEVWWLWQREFVTNLLEEASRIGHTFRRRPPPRIQPDARIKSREARRAALARRPKRNTKRVGRRLIELPQSLRRHPLLNRGQAPHQVDLVRLQPAPVQVCPGLQFGQ